MLYISVGTAVCRGIKIMRISPLTALKLTQTIIATKWCTELKHLDDLIERAARKGEYAVNYEFCPKIFDRYLRDFGYKVVWDGANATISW